MTLTTTELPRIDLAELIERGSLQNRLDRKYALTAADAAMALDLVDPTTTRLLEINAVSNLGYTSTYFDTAGLDTFLLAARGRRRRFKVRTRRYESDGSSFLEVKTRQRDRTVKHRLAGEHVRDGRLTSDGRGFVDEVLWGTGIRDVWARALTASLRVDYRRVTLFHEPSASRVTIDTGLTWWDVRTHAWLCRPELAIIETKSAGRASGIDRLLWSMGRRENSISKYATALAAMHPHLPSNKWRPVLKRHFGPAGGARS